MEDSGREPTVLTTTKQKVGALTNIGDYLNTLKAFIGTNYLALGFAFSNSGIIFGIVGVFIIATLTDFCCQLLIKCKYILIDRLVDEDTAQRPLSAIELSNLRKKLERSIGYGDIGRLTFGSWCEVVINLTVVFTQFLTVVCYFIFIGNALFTIFPMAPAMVPYNGSATPILNESFVDHHGLRNGIPMLSIDNIDYKHSDSYHRQRRGVDWQPAILRAEDVCKNSTTTTTELPITNITTPEGGNTTNTTTTRPTTPVPTPHYYERSTAPDLIYLVITPLPIFLLTGLIRKMRILSPLTVIATASLFIGAVAVLAFVCVGFTIASEFSWIKFETLPLFIGQLTSAYEGIGCVLPIESSMEGNRHLFPRFLHLAIYTVFIILTAFGITGYLRYGEAVQQIIILSMPQHSWLSVAVDITLIISVICTFPLQMFPVIQIIESYLFGPGRCCGPPPPSLIVDNDHGPLINADETEIEHSTSSYRAPDGHEVAVEIPQTVPAWKRNILRLTLTILSMGCGIAVRNSYAYVTAFAGAVGCSLLAFILPCAIHLQLKRHDLNLCQIIWDLFIIFLSIVCSVLVIVIIIFKIVKHQMAF